jgi:hypothetical protein
MMEDYSDRIGEPVRGWDDDGSEAWGLFFGTRMIDNRYGVVYHRTKRGKAREWFEHIEFLIPSVFRHYGKRARVWETGDIIKNEGVIISVSENGKCIVVTAPSTIESFEADGEHSWFDHYELIKDPTYTLTKDGEPVDLTPEQIRKIEEIMK